MDFFNSLLRGVLEEGGHEDDQDTEDKGGVLKRETLNAGFFFCIREVFEIEEVDGEKEGEKENFDTQGDEVAVAEDSPHLMTEMDIDPPCDKN
jgi:hypothetical protein